MAERSPAQVLDVLARDRKLRVFVRGGKLEALPSRRSTRLALLIEIAHAFEPGVRYSEREVNRVLGAIHPDYAALRRYLIDEDLMERAQGMYWRIGGPVLSDDGQVG